MAKWDWRYLWSDPQIVGTVVGSPTWDSGFKDPMFSTAVASQLQLGDLIIGLGTPYAMGWPKRGEKKLITITFAYITKSTDPDVRHCWIKISIEFP